MLHHKVRRAVAVAAVASVAVTVPLATPAGAQSSDSPQVDPTVRVQGSDGVAPDDTLAPAPGPEGNRVRLRIRNRDVRAVTTTRTWARRLLDDERISYDGNDLVRVRRDGDLVTQREKRVLRAGDAVQLIAVDTVVTTRRAEIKVPTRVRTVARLRPGQRQVVAGGRHGVKKIRVVKTRHNRKVVDVDRSSSIVREPRPRRVIVGAAERSVPGTAQLNWSGLARCESGGNPRAVNPAGYYGLYQFSVPTWGSVGGSGLPSGASASEQTYRAKLLFNRQGRSPWPNCGRYL